MLTRIDTVFIPVHDLSRAIDWYSHVLGLKLKWTMEKYACLELGETPLTLVQQPALQAPSFSHELLNFFSTDVDGVHHALREHGVAVGDIMEPSHGLRYFTFLDLDGNRLGICQW